MADVSGMNEKLFSHPEVEADMSAPNKKIVWAKQLATFNKIQEQAVEKMQQLEDFITYQVVHSQPPAPRFTSLLRHF